jgi:hypothetical protein
LKKLSFDCGDKVYVQGKRRIENGIVCQSINTTDEKLKIRIVMEDGKVTNKPIGKIVKR